MRRPQQQSSFKTAKLEIGHGRKKLVLCCSKNQ